MSQANANSYTHYQLLSSNEGATAAAVDLISAACGAGDDTKKTSVLIWAIEEDNLRVLRDRIKEAASGD